MKKFILPALLLATTMTTYAGPDEEPEVYSYKNYMRVYLGGGISHMNFSSFNNMAQVNNFPAPRNGVSPSFNLGMMLREPRSNFFTDINLALIPGGGHDGDGYKSNSFASILNCSWNYIVFEQKRHFIYPGLGFGWMSNKMTYEQDISGQNFGQTMQTINGERTFSSNWNWYLNPQIAYDYQLGEHTRIAIGIVAGYRIGLNKPKWKVGQDQELADAPKSTANGFYTDIRLIF